MYLHLKYLSRSQSRTYSRLHHRQLPKSQSRKYSRFHPRSLSCLDCDLKIGCDTMLEHACLVSPVNLEGFATFLPTANEVCEDNVFTGVCLSRERASQGGGGVHCRRDGHCNGRYASYWNAFLWAFCCLFYKEHYCCRPSPSKLDYESALLVTRYLASNRPFSQSFDIYLTQVCYCIMNNVGNQKRV